MFNLNIMASKALALPAGTPADVVDAYNKAMAAVVEDLSKPDYKEKADEIVGPYPQALGQQAADVLHGAVKFDESTYMWLQDWNKKETDD